MTETSASSVEQTDASHLEESLASVRAALAQLKYGSINLTIHEGRVVQIDVTEKRRLKPN